ncbi:MAG: helix-turn-helix transcriptional regulator [Phycisphaerales bacterium]
MNQPHPHDETRRLPPAGSPIPTVEPVGSAGQANSAISAADSASIAAALTRVLLHENPTAAGWLRNASVALDALILADGESSPVVSASVYHRQSDGGLGRALNVWRHPQAPADEPGWVVLALPNLCQSHLDLIPAAAWAGSGTRAKRLQAGLDGFVQVALVIPWVDGDGLLVFRADLPARMPGMAQRASCILRILSGPLRDGFVHAVAEPERHRRAMLDSVSPTQRPILQRLVDGMTEREIAQALERSPFTVHDHVKLIYRTLGVSTRFELVELWSGREPRKGRSTRRAAGRSGR